MKMRLSFFSIVLTAFALVLSLQTMSVAAEDGGYHVTSDLWAKAILRTPGKDVTLIWSSVGSDTTPSGDKVVSGYFYAHPNDFAYGSLFNPEVFVKIYIAASGWANIAFNHVTVDDVVVYSAHNYGGTAEKTGTITLSSRLAEHSYTGVSAQEADGAASLKLLPFGISGISSLASIEAGYTLTSSLWSKAVLQPASGPVTLIWKAVGADTTPSGARVVSGYFYADPDDFAYGSVYNPEIFVKVYIDPNGWANIAFNHVTVDNVDVSSAHHYSGAADQAGTVTLNNRLAEQQYTGVVISDDQEFQFSGKLELTPDVAYTGEERIITAMVSLIGGSNDTSDVKLVRVGTSEIDVAAMLDDGACASGTCASDASGDEIAGDNVYTGRFTLNESAEGTLIYRVVAVQKSGGDSIRSEDFDVMITEHLTDTKLNELLTKQSGYQTQLDNASDQGTLPDTIETILSELQSDPDVLQAGESDGGQGVWIMYKDGVGGVLYTPEEGTKGSGSTGGDARNGSLPATNRLVSYPPYDSYRSVGPDIKSKINFNTLADDKNKVESNKARVIAAQYFDWGENDDIPKMKAVLDDSCFDVEYSTYNASGAGSVEDFKNLDDYGIVLVSSHGDSFYNGLFSLWEDKFGWDWPFGIVIIDSNMKVTAANKATYEDDLKKGRLVLWGGTYGITPTFIQKYSTDFPNSMVYMSICRGAWNSSMADAFTSSGAGAYFGYSDYVAVSFCVLHGPPLLQGLLEPGKTIADVFVAGKKETDSDPAEFKLYGAKDLSIEVSGLQDGSFESGNISQAWTVAGDGRTITGLGSSSPTDGSFMGIISTGLGFTTDSGSISQTICLSSDASKLLFDWNFFSEEFKEYCNSSYDDTFEVSITDLDTNIETVLFKTSVNTLCGNENALISSPVSFDKGDAWYTGWRTNQSVNISAYQGKSVKLEFYSTDIGDSIYDTAILIDNIQIVEE